MAQINVALTLASNASAGNGTPVTWLGGKGFFLAEGTGTGTLALQIKSPSGTWLTVSNPNGTAISLTASGTAYFECPPGQLRLSSATFTAISAYVIGVNQ